MNMNKCHIRMFSLVQYIVVTLLLWAGISATAVAANMQITIWKKQGGSISYALSAKPRITYHETELLLSTNDAAVTYPLADVDRITFEAVPSGINPITQQGQGHSLITVTPDGIKIEGTTPQEPVKLYTIDGRLLHTLCTDSRGTLCIRLGSAAEYQLSGKPIIVIKAAQSTLKITLP